MSELSSGLTAELLVDGTPPLYPVISPDGRWVCYVVATTGADGALWLAAVDGGPAPRVLMAGGAWDWDPRWAPDSLSLYVNADGQLHRLGLDGHAEPLTRRRGSIRGHLPLADGYTVAVVAPDEPSDEDQRRRADGDDAIVLPSGTGRCRLWLLDLDSRALRMVDGLGDRHVVEVAQRPDGGPLAVMSWACVEMEPGAWTARLHVLDAATGAVRDLGPVGLEARSPVWWRAGARWHLSYLAMTPPGPVGGTAVFDVDLPDTGGTTGHRNLTAGMAVCPSELAQVTDGPPVALFAAGLDTAVYRLDPDGPRFRHLATTAGHLDMLSASRTGESVAARVSTSGEPRDVHAGPVDGPLVRLGETRPELRGIEWGRQERLSYRAGDGLVLDGLLILPPGRGRADGPFPLVTLVHGGPYGRYADELTIYGLPPGQWLAAAGYAVFLPNPRGGEGHGPEFAASVAGAVGQDEWTDILTGIDLLIADGVADPDRVGIGGWSHGGFLAAWAVGQTDRFRAAVMGAGISDWGMQVAAGDFGTQEAGLGGSCGWEGTGPHRHDWHSPISYASRIRTPVLMLHGQNDTNVPVGQAMYLHRALLRYGVEHELVVYPREGHRITERAHQLDLLHRTRAWFDRWLT